VYSQYDEEKYILESCREIDKGRFLDIGAWNAKTFSNTRALYELGWSGVMVEPSPEAMISRQPDGTISGLIAEYGNDPQITLVQALVDEIPGLKKLAVTADSVSTTVYAHYEKWKTKGGYYGQIVVPAVSLFDLETEFGDFDFVSIDAEGMSAHLFFVLLHPKRNKVPQCICVEYDDRLEELSHHAALYSYRLVYSNGTNAVFSR